MDAESLRAIRWAASLGVTIALVAVARVGAQGPLPAFTLTAPDGHAVARAEVVRSGRQLFIYASPECRACERLIRALGAWQSPAVIEGSVVIVRGSAPEARAYVDALRSESLANLRWYIDEDGTLWRALNLRDTPALLGIKDGRIEWTLSGVLNDPSSVESVVRTWLSQQP